MKILNGSELVGYIKERQAKQVRGLRQAWRVFPKLAIIIASDNPVIDTYVRLKQRYGEDILIDVAIYRVEQTEVKALIQTLNNDVSVHGIVVQLPLADASETDAIVTMIAPEKDVDGLAGARAQYTSATATAIDWLLAGYNVTLRGKKIAIVGNGRLVGAPLAALWQKQELDVTVYDDTAPSLDVLRLANVIVTATGVPGLITSAMVGPSAVVVDAGTASENGVIVGDVAADVRERGDITITPEKGGVGPLTIAALFDNVITAARKTADDDSGLTASA